MAKSIHPHKNKKGRKYAVFLHKMTFSVDSYSIYIYGY